MHSLDSSSTQETGQDESLAARNKHQGKPLELGATTAGAAAPKPSGAGTNDEYAIVRETSGDFIDLRRVLVMSPLLNRQTSGLQLNGGPVQYGDEDRRQEGRLSFSGSIFGAILDSGRRAEPSPLNDGVALHHGGGGGLEMRYNRDHGVDLTVRECARKPVSRAQQIVNALHHAPKLHLNLTPHHRRHRLSWDRVE